MTEYSFFIIKRGHNNRLYLEIIRIVTAVTVILLMLTQLMLF